jgi:FkbM family methyltransferase
MDAYENADSYEFDRNGEAFVLRAWSGFPLKCIFDVGANVGDWALLARSFFPAAAIHCFEIMGVTAEQLRRRTAGMADVTVNEFGLLDREGEIELRYFPSVSSITTITPYPHEYEHVPAKGRAVPGDAYIEAHGIERIDLLKLDVEGAENLVLKGLDKTISAGRIDAVQFEYGKVCILTKFLLRDFCEYFAARGYRVGKIYPDQVVFRDYDFTHEDFRGSNYLAVRRQRQDLIDAVS